ncbi:MAG: hypothetical protein CVU11_00870 [Bacteroidetes bacterium HGW-Bacteroidetes-6]|jgi:hypothetical protein|nr:MAG: hypothetical protein CVU11_00870 [Bacteroidetes bacterium HGW-Bacteroidetes-6]
MKKSITFSLVLFALMLTSSAFGQDWRSFTWDDYMTKFKIPSDFEVTTNTAEKFSATNGKITLSIYPREDENLEWDEMEDALQKWADDNEVENQTEIIELDEEKMNGYWGVLIEGTKNDYSVGQMLLVDPDFTEISLYVWVAYDSDQVDTVIEMLMSFEPM